MYPKLIEDIFIKIKPQGSFISLFANNRRFDLKINKSAEDILSLCNGFYSIEEIVGILSKKYNENSETVTEFVNEIIENFSKSNVIVDEKSTENKNITRGDATVYLPDSVIWEITEACPLRCKHCYLGDKDDYLATDSDIKKVLNMIYKSGVTIVQITGGEALTHPKFGFIVDELVKNKITISITTSGTVFNEDIFNAIEKIKSVSGSVQVSLDGCKEYHNNIRGRSYAYDKSIEFIKKLVERGVKCSIATCLIDQSEEEIDQLCGIVKNLGVFMMTTSLIVTQGNAKSTQLIDTYTHTRARNLIKKLNDKYKSENFIVREYGETTEQNCGAGYNLLRIKPNLDVTPCPMISLKMGNLGVSDVADISKRFGELYRNIKIPDDPICEQCEKKEKCGRCSARGLDEIGDNCCWYQKQKALIDKITNGGNVCC